MDCAKTTEATTNLKFYSNFGSELGDNVTSRFQTATDLRTEKLFELHTPVVFIGTLALDTSQRSLEQARPGE